MLKNMLKFKEIFNTRKSNIKRITLPKKLLILVSNFLLVNFVIHLIEK